MPSSPRRPIRLFSISASVSLLTALTVSATAVAVSPARADTTSSAAAAATAPDDAKHERARQQKAARISDQLLAALVEVSGVPGMGAAVWKDGKVIWTGSAGYRDLERKKRVDRNTIFRLASVSKLITVTAAALLRQQGKLDVDAPISTIVPDLSPRWAPLTARQLAAHISGVPHYQPVDSGRGATHYPTVAAALPVFKDRELLFPPGTAYQYSSWAYTLLSAAVERAAGQPFLAYVARHVTRGVPVAPDVTDKSAAASRAYELVDGKPVAAAPHDFSYTWGGGGFGSTPRAIAELGGRIMTGKVVAPQTFEWMLVPATFADGKTVEDDGNTIGFGWRTNVDDDGHRLAHHSGNALGARSSLMLWPALGFTASLLSNASWVSSIDLSARILAAPFQPEPKTLVRAACPTSAARFHGTFEGKPISGDVRFAVKDGLCVGELPLDNALGEYLNSSATKKGTTRLAVIGMDARGELSRAALVTPIGLYDLRATSTGEHRAAFGKRVLSIAFIAAAP